MSRFGGSMMYGVLRGKGIIIIMLSRENSYLVTGIVVVMSGH